jgi:hypothetical protein
VVVWFDKKLVNPAFMPLLPLCSSANVALPLLTLATPVVSKVNRSFSTFVVLLVAVLALFQPLATRMQIICLGLQTKIHIAYIQL